MSKQKKTIKKDPLAEAIESNIENVTKESLIPDELKQSWEDLNRIYEKCGEAIIAIGNSVNTALSYPGILEHVDNASELKLTINTLKNDLEHFTCELINIKSRHADKTGLVTDENDLANCISIFEDYVSFSSKFQTIITPTLVNIIEKVTLAMHALKEKENKQNDNITCH